MLLRSTGFTRLERQVQRQGGLPPSGSHKMGSRRFLVGVYGMVGWDIEGRGDRVDGGLWLPPSCSASSAVWMTGQKFIAFFFILHLPCKVKEVTVRGQRRGRHHEAVITALNKDIFWARGLCFDLMSLLKSVSVAQWVCTLLVTVSLLCCAEDQTRVLQMVQNYVAA